MSDFQIFEDPALPPPQQPVNIRNRVRDIVVTFIQNDPTVENYKLLKESIQDLFVEVVNNLHNQNDPLTPPLFQFAAFLMTPPQRTNDAIVTKANSDFNLTISNPLRLYHYRGTRMRRSPRRKNRLRHSKRSPKSRRSKRSPKLYRSGRKNWCK